LEFVVFFVNSILFFAAGDQIHLPKLVQNIQTTALAIAAIIVTRALTIYGFSALSNWLAKTEIPWREQNRSVVYLIGAGLTTKLLLNSICLKINHT